MSRAGANSHPSQSIFSPHPQSCPPNHPAAETPASTPCREQADEVGAAARAQMKRRQDRNERCQRLRAGERLPKSLAAIGTGLSLTTILAYGLTRPCVLGPCPAVAQAKQLAQVKPSELNPSRPDLQQLAQTVEQLAAIPAWSPHAAEANALLDEAGQLASLQTIVAAQADVAEATGLSAATQIQVAQQAIAALETIAADSNLSELAQTQIQQYQRQIARIKQAQTGVAAARSAAELAQLRTSAARSLSDWQLVEATWKTAIQRLEDAADTTLAAESQQLLSRYSSELQTVQQRRQQEELALNTHNQAAALAKRALDSEANNQWSTAVAHWRNALSTIKQIPEETSQYQHSHPLINRYAEALKQAQAHQRNYSDLGQVCFQDICRYLIEKHRIKIYLSEAYTKQVRQTALDAKVRNNLQAQVDLLDHIASLEKGLETVGYNAELPIEVYSPQKALLLILKSQNK